MKNYIPGYGYNPKYDYELFDEPFKSLLRAVSTAAPDMFNALPIVSSDIRHSWVFAGFSRCEIYRGKNAPQNTPEKTSLMVLLRLFKSVGLVPITGTKSTNYTFSAMMAISHMLATVAKTVSAEDPSVTKYTNWETVLTTLEIYHSNLLLEGQCLKVHSGYK